MGERDTLEDGAAPVLQKPAPDGASGDIYYGLLGHGGGG
jgi:hypothetical protein